MLGLARQALPGISADADLWPSEDALAKCEPQVEGFSSMGTVEQLTAADQPIRVHARTRRAVLTQLGLAAAVFVVILLAAAHGYEWSAAGLAGWSISYWLMALVWWALSEEWTIAGRKLRRRDWLSPRGYEPAEVIELGPEAVIVHESAYRWRIRPNGPAMGVWPWEEGRLVEAMGLAGVGVNDRHGDWMLRHRLLAGLRLVAQFGGLLSLLATVAAGRQWVWWVQALCVSIGVLILGLAIDTLPWTLRRPS
jgi:hypothetical protein